jgi:hypothetical protein
MVAGGLELSGRDHPDLAVQASMVEPIDVLESLAFDVIDAAPRSLVKRSSFSRFW